MVQYRRWSYYKIIPDWWRKKLICYYCGTNKSVKYAVRSGVSTVYCCNKCITKL